VATDTQKATIPQPQSQPTPIAIMKKEKDVDGDNNGVSQQDEKKKKKSSVRVVDPKLLGFTAANSSRVMGEIVRDT